MFPGNNKLQLNHACMIEAVQMYLDSKFKDGESPNVKRVSEHSGTTASECYFNISTEVEETEKAAG